MNLWQLVEAAAGAAYADTNSLRPPAMLRGLLNATSTAGLTVLRGWAHGVLPQYRLMLSPGNYSEPIFRGLDYLLDLVRRHDMRIILSVSDKCARSRLERFV